MPLPYGLLLFYCQQHAKFLIYFPTFSLVVDGEFDSYLSYKLLGHDYKHFEFIQLPKKVSALHTYQPCKCKSTTSNTHSHVISPDNSDTDDHLLPVRPLHTPPTPDDNSDSNLEFPPLPNALIMIVPTPKQSCKTRLGTPPERINSDDLLLFCNNPSAPAPAVRPCDTPNGSDGLRHFTSDKINKLLRNQRFWNYEHFCITSKDSKFINGGKPTSEKKK